MRCRVSAIIKIARLCRGLTVYLLLLTVDYFLLAVSPACGLSRARTLKSEEDSKSILDRSHCALGDFSHPAG